MNKLENKLLKHHVGYLSERDEYELGMIYKILAQGNMLTFYLVTILMILSLVWDIYHQTFSLGTFLLLFVQQFNTYYLILKLRKYNVHQTEFYDQTSYNKQVKALKKKALLTSISFGFLMLIIMEFILPTISRRGINFSWLNLPQWFIAGAALGTTTYFTWKNQLKIIKE